MEIVVRNVHFAYQHKPDEPTEYVLQDVSFSVPRGQYVAILGKNGSGKSTLAKLVGGLLSPTKGSVEIGGVSTSDAEQRKQVRRQVGMVFQNPDNQMVATVVEEDIAFGLENLCIPREEMLERVTEALKAVGMLEHRHRPPHQLSGGQKQRIAIAAVMAMRPNCIVFDEATSMLDVQGRNDVLRLMDALHREGKTILTITHHMSEALRAERVIVIDSGRIILDGTPGDVFSQVEILRSLHLDVPVAADMTHRLGLSTVLSGIDLARTLKSLPGSRIGRAVEERPARPANRGAEDATDRSDSDRKPIDGQPITGQPIDGQPINGQPDDGQPIVEATALSHCYMRNTPMERWALKDITLRIQPGEIVAILGHTGSGKSTLIQHFNALLMPQAGRLVVDGISVGERKSDIKRVRQTVGLVFQNPEEQLFETLIGDDIAYGPFQFGLSVDEARERVKMAMEVVGLDFSWRDRPIQHLSGGQKRKVAIAGVIANRPKVLVLDEPTAGLDPKSRDELLSSLEALNRIHGTTIVIVTHQMEEVARLVDKVFVLSNGQIVRETTPRALFADTSFLAAYGLGVPESVELADQLKQEGIPIDGIPLTRDELFSSLYSLLYEGDKHGVL